MKEKRENPMKGILGFAGDKKKELMSARILSFLSVLAGFIPYICIAILLNGILEKRMEHGRVILLLAAAWSGYLIKTLLFSKATMMSHRAAYQIMKNIRMRLMDKLAKIPMGEIQKKTAGEIKHLIIDDVEQLEYPLAHAIPEQMGYTLLPVLVIVFLITIDFRLALASLASSVLGTLAYSGIMLGHGEMMKRYMEANATMNGTIVEYINGMEVIKAFNQGDSSFKKFHTAVVNVKDMTLKWYRRCWPYMSLGQAIMPSCIAFVLPVGILLLRNSSVTQGELITSIVLALGIVGALQKRIEFREHEAVFYELQPKIAAALEEVELETTRETTGDFIKEAVKVYDIEFKKVSFAYDKQEVLHDISLKIPQGTSTALIGPSGSGKSTLAKLLNRFWDVTEGEIRIGGRNLKSFSMKELTDMVSYVSQDTFLFGRSIMDNIRIGKPDATDQEVMRAARLAQCEEFIQRFPDGYRTNAADAGKRLSGGERQRIVLARAILKDAPIVILDEATAFVDPENEDKIQDAIVVVTKNKTLITIAHRLSTVMFLDQLILLEKGNIAARGSHEELLDTSDTYRRMWEAHLTSTAWSLGGGAQND
ncbi:ATP-binding cassette subfamily B protein [Lachnotalea glycerini]|uniref:ATP-binding cassette subfamily B protein n=1 Tax=Lachnotalea glycerini TaxID=1763509 RepID=A0A318ESG2_9FIRM|nr:ABC transporter ATP-binding protein [Lachnotalea glycerini]PXV95901.1 ATP-binding cassette subfamily B protein [Lachnotalea glycerini]